jgi:hypothetical protein
MERKSVTIVAALVAMASAALPVQARTAQTSRSTMGPVAAYLIANRASEIALARSAAPPSISGQAEVMVLGRNGFEVAVPGTNHFVCLVERSWDAAVGSRNFWDPGSRGPDCFNQAAALSYLPIVFMKTRLALEGKSEAQIGAAVQAAFDRNKLPAMQSGAMCYMMSKQANFSNGGGNWHPHLMFFVPFTMRGSWGANLPGSPVLSADDAPDRLTIFMVPVTHWSDGTPDLHAGM